MADGRELEYSVTQFVVGTVVLESVWQDLDDEQQDRLMSSVVDAMTKIQCLKLEDKAVQAILSETAFISQEVDAGTSIQHALGGPEIGYSKDITALLAGIIKVNNPKSPTSSIQIPPSSDGVTIASTYEDLGHVHISQSNLEFLRQRSVFCHNDLEPRNLLVRAVGAADGRQLYELSAIIDWEMAGFYPFAYEYCLKDSLLGSSNIYFSWYTLFKQRTAFLLPVDESSEAFSHAVDLIHESRRKQMRNNVGKMICEKWIEREKLVRVSNVRDGWVRRADAGTVRRFTKDDNQKLEDEVLRALGRI